MKKIYQLIYQLVLVISFFLIEFSLKIKNHRICAFVIWLNIRKIKSIKSNLKNVKKVLVFPKTGGYEDLVESHYNQNDNNIIFYILPRLFLKKIFIHHFKRKYTRDYITKAVSSNEPQTKKRYIKFLTNTFYSLDKLIKIDGFISFNIFYYAEKHLDEVFKNLKKKYVILHKESTLTPIEEINAAEVYKKCNDRSLAHKISVYSESQKKILIKSKIASRKQIYVNGCPRSNYAFRLRKIKPKKNFLVYYLIEKNRGNSLFLNKVNINWNKLYDQTLDLIIEFAKNNYDVNIILKGKVGVHKKEHFSSKILPENCSFVEGQTGERFLRDASVVIAFNSMIVLETIASNRNLIIPNFNNENVKKEKMMVKIANRKYFVNSKKQFIKQLKFYLNLKYVNKKLSNTDKKTLKYYLGFSDGKSGKKMKNFFKKTFN